MTIRSSHQSRKPERGSFKAAVRRGKGAHAGKRRENQRGQAECCAHNDMLDADGGGLRYTDRKKIPLPLSEKNTSRAHHNFPSDVGWV